MFEKLPTGYSFQATTAQGILPQHTTGGMRESERGNRCKHKIHKGIQVKISCIRLKFSIEPLAEAIDT